MPLEERGALAGVGVIESALDLLIPGFWRRDLAASCVSFVGIDSAEESQERRLCVSLIVLQGELVDTRDAHQEEHDTNGRERKRLGGELVFHLEASWREAESQWAGSVLGSVRSMEDLPELCRLPEELRLASISVGAKLASKGARVWVVGGAVRDQVLGRTPTDVDLATDATPDEVEACFDETVPVGKKFGTVLVMRGGLGIEVTTLRAESGYEDARRPSDVKFETSVAADASRRDFSCNAMYLDTQSGEFLDPVHGLADCRSGKLRAVGDPAARFAEDGLRILRLARFCAALEMSPEEGTVAGARASCSALRGVSGERLLAELERGFASGRGAVMLRMLAEIGVGRELYPDSADGATALSADFFSVWPESAGLLEGLLLFLDPDPSGASAPREQRLEAALQALDGLRPPRQLKRSWSASWRLAAEIESTRTDELALGDLRLWMREEHWATASALAMLTVGDSTGHAARIAAWRHERASLSHDELFPSPWIGADELKQAGFEPGAIYGQLMGEALKLQLGGAWTGRQEALAWLGRQA